jgi:uncharacterized membrane protein
MSVSMIAARVEWMLNDKRNTLTSRVCQQQFDHGGVPFLGSHAQSGVIDSAGIDFRVLEQVFDNVYVAIRSRHANWHVAACTCVLICSHAFKHCVWLSSGDWRRGFYHYGSI